MLGTVEVRRSYRPNWKRRAVRMRDSLLRDLGDEPNQRELLLAEAAASLKIRLQRAPDEEGAPSTLNALRRLLSDLDRARRTRRHIAS